MHIELHDFGAIASASVCDISANAKRSVRRKRRGRNFQIRKLECCVAQPVAKRKQWCTALIEISGMPAIRGTGAAGVFMIVVSRNLADGAHPGKRQMSARRSVA